MHGDSRQHNNSSIYINHLGGTKSPVLRTLSVSLWEWCLQRHLYLMTSPIPGVTNTRADLLSRFAVDRHDWQLNPDVFKTIDLNMGSTSGTGGLVNFKDLSTNREVLHLAARSTIGGSGRVQPGLDQIHRLYQPSMELGGMVHNMSSIKERQLFT